MLCMSPPHLFGMWRFYSLPPSHHRQLLPTAVLKEASQHLPVHHGLPVRWKVCMIALQRYFASPHHPCCRTSLSVFCSSLWLRPSPICPFPIQGVVSQGLRTNHSVSRGSELLGLEWLGNALNPERPCLRWPSPHKIVLVLLARMARRQAAALAFSTSTWKLFGVNLPL